MYLTRHVVLQFLFRKPYGIHSPFLYDFAEKCLYSREKDIAFERIEKERRQLLNDHSWIEVTDFGQGAGKHRKQNGEEPLHYRRKISSIARHSLQSPAYCRLFYRVAGYFSPARILELGTSLGITTAYFALADPQARIITLEGCPRTADKARELFYKMDARNIETRTGPFKDTLDGALESLGKIDLVYLDGDHSYEGVMNYYRKISEHIHHDSVLILDDIRWSDGMKKAWLEMAADSKVTLAVDLFKIGILFFNPALSKQIIPVGY